MPLGTTPYDSADYVLNIARSLGNDAIQTLAGSLLADSQSYVTVFLNSGYRALQRRLANAGYATFKKTVQIIGVPVIGQLDPGMQLEISYTGTYDGVENHATPVLPADFNWPLKLWERQTLTTQIWQPMSLARNGLISRPQSIWLHSWLYEQEQLVFRGATQVNDLQLRYVPFLPELVLTPEPSQVPLLRCENALAAYVLYAYALARGSALLAEIKSMADNFVNEMLRSDAMTKTHGNLRRKGYSHGLHRGFGRM
jgi:hypothetical protein